MDPFLHDIGLDLTATISKSSQSCIRLEENTHRLYLATQHLVLLYEKIPCV